MLPGRKFHLRIGDWPCLDAVLYARKWQQVAGSWALKRRAALLPTPFQTPLKKLGTNSSPIRNARRRSPGVSFLN
jgi:hypothetical protein